MSEALAGRENLEISESKVLFSSSIFFRFMYTLNQNVRFNYFFKAQVIPGCFYGVNSHNVKFHVKIALDAKIAEREMRLRGMQLENTLYRLHIPVDDVGGGKEEIHFAVARSCQIHPCIKFVNYI